MDELCNAKCKSEGKQVGRLGSPMVGVQFLQVEKDKDGILMLWHDSSSFLHASPQTYKVSLPLLSRPSPLLIT